MLKTVNLSLFKKTIQAEMKFSWSLIIKVQRNRTKNWIWQTRPLYFKTGKEISTNKIMKGKFNTHVHLSTLNQSSSVI